MRSNLLCASVALALLSPLAAHAGLLGSWIGEATANTPAASTTGNCRPESGFSPEGSASRLVDRAIDHAQHSIRLAAYSFTSADVVRRLIEAKQRGVDVAVIVDEKNNLVEDRSGRARAALNLLVNAGIPTRTINVYPIHHDNRNPEGCYMAVHACFPESVKVADAFVLRQGGELARRRTCLSHQCCC